MKPRAKRTKNTVTLAVLVLALAVTAAIPVAAADPMVVEDSGTTATFVGFWTGPGTQVLIFVLAVPEEAPEPETDSEDDKDGVILEDGAPF